MEQINVIANIFGSSGYASHSRNLVNALNKLIPVKLVCPLPNNFLREVNDQELEMIKRPQDDKINLIITLPNYWKIDLNAERNFVYLVWEGDKIPKSFIKDCMDKRIEKIIVPSIHTETAIANSCNGDNVDKIMSKVIVIPHGVNLELFYPIKSDKDKFTFLLNKGWRNNQDRGGTQYAIKAFMEEFTNKEKVRLIVKINSAYGIPNIDKLLKEMDFDKRTDLPELIIDATEYNYNELIKLYNNADVFVCATRAESFGIPGLEAKACGLPTIQTNFGGQIDYMKQDTDFYIDYKLIEVKHELSYEGIKWAIPDIDHLKVLMRHCYNNKEEIKERGKKAIETAKEFTWENTAKAIFKYI
jgi:glycosyltransferase involved in cell wall biosynthesis